MNLSVLQPRPELRRYVESMWVFESDVGIPAADNSLAAPNGRPKIIILCENSLHTFADGRARVSPEQDLYFVGTRDIAPHIWSAPGKTSFIGIEFSPFGAYPFFGIPMHEMTNRVFASDEIFGGWGREVRESLRNLDTVAQKLNFIQDQLLGLL